VSVIILDYDWSNRSLGGFIVLLVVEDLSHIFSQAMHPHADADEEENLEDVAFENLLGECWRLHLLSPLALQADAEKDNGENGAGSGKVLEGIVDDKLVRGDWVAKLWLWGIFVAPIVTIFSSTHDHGSDVSGVESKTDALDETERSQNNEDPGRDLDSLSVVFDHGRVRFLLLWNSNLHD
jgi:hypothetical protein